MELMQFSAVMLLTLLLLKLLLLPRKVAVNPVMGKARWLMIAGIAMLDVQFLLQFALGLRAMGVTQAVMVNLILFIPSSWTISLALLYLQRQGSVNIVEKAMGGITWVMALALLGTAIATDGAPLLSNTRALFGAEVVSSVFFLAMQGFYCERHLSNLRAMRRVLLNYYDRDTDGLLQWMKLSILALMALAIMVPLLIFVDSPGLAVFGILFFAGIFFLVDSFSSYVVSSAPMKVRAATESEAQEDKERQMVDEELTTTNGASELSTEVLDQVEKAIMQWVDNRGFLKGSFTLPAAADAIGVPRYLLTAWLKREKDRTYTSWMNSLRIEEALRTFKEHPDWNNETVAEHCGFTDRTYFHRKFKEKMGMTPTQYCANDETEK